MTSQDSIRKILIAIDKSGYKDKIVSTAFELSRGLGAEIMAIHVISRASLGPAGDMRGFYRGGTVESDVEVLKAEGTRLLEEVRQAGESAGARVSIEVVVNPSVAGAIIDFAKNNNINLIIVGTKGMSGIERFLMGSVASNVISHAHCPVLAIR